MSAEMTEAQTEFNNYFLGKQNSCYLELYVALYTQELWKKEETLKPDYWIDVRETYLDVHKDYPEKKFHHVEVIPQV